MESLAYVDEPTYCVSSCKINEAEYPCGGENALSIYVAGMNLKMYTGSSCNMYTRIFKMEV